MEKKSAWKYISESFWFCLFGLRSTVENTFTQNWVFSFADTERHSLANYEAVRPTSLVIISESESYLTAAKSKQQVNLS